MNTAVPEITVTSEDSNRKISDDEDDEFEKELNSFIESEDKSDDEKQLNSTEPQAATIPDSTTEKGTWEIESGKKEEPAQKTSENHSDSEPEGDDYEFTEDQKRAMMEYRIQREEDGFPDEDPPEYDVKDKLIKYNAELAQDDTPLESTRESKVVFKDELVDLVAPPPDFPSDDDQTPREQVSESKDDSSKSDDSESSKNSRQVVVERDGQFSVLNVQDLTASERKMHNIESPTGDKPEDSDKKMEKDTNNSNISAKSKHPSPPSHARPATANGHSRRKMRPVSAPQRPKSAVVQSSQLQNFDYNSPYAMSPSEKEAAARRAKYWEEKKKQDSEQKKKKEQDSKTSNEQIFHSWLSKKQNEKQKEKQKEVEQERKEKEKNPDKDKDGSQHSESEPDQDIDSVNSNLSDENKEAYKGWLKTKRSQLHREKLLKKREEQEKKEGFYFSSREECDKAFKEWIKQKNIESRKARASEKHRNRAHRVTVRRSRKSMALMRAIRQAQSFKYVDYYGYRY